MIGTTDYEHLEASVSTLRPPQSDSQAQSTFTPAYSPVTDSLERREDQRAGPSRSAAFGPISPTAAPVDRPSSSGPGETERTPLLPPGIGHGRKLSSASRRLSTANQTRRGSVRSRRKSVIVMEWGKSTDGQTVSPSLKSRRTDLCRCLL